MSTPAASLDGTRKLCVECGRWMSANDQHRKCQKCRPYGGAGNWPTGWSAEYQRKRRAAKRAELHGAAPRTEEEGT